MNIQRIDQPDNELIIYYQRHDGKDTRMRMVLEDNETDTVVGAINEVLKQGL